MSEMVIFSHLVGALLADSQVQAIQALPSLAASSMAAVSTALPSDIEPPSKIARRWTKVQESAKLADQVIGGLVQATTSLNTSSRQIVDALAATANAMDVDNSSVQITTEGIQKMSDLLAQVLKGTKVAGDLHKKLVQIGSLFEDRVGKALRVNSKIETATRQLDEVANGKWPPTLPRLKLVKEVPEHSTTKVETLPEDLRELKI